MGRHPGPIMESPGPDGPERHDADARHAHDAGHAEEIGHVAAAKAPPPRVLPILLIATAVLGLLLTGTIGVFSAAGPELASHQPGGEAGLNIYPNCERTFSWQEQEPCFSNVTARARDANGNEHNVTLTEGLGWYGAIRLATARATILVDSDQGTWTREVWIPAQGYENLQIRADDAAVAQAVIGRATGFAWLMALPFGLAALLMGNTISWMATGTPRAGKRVRGTIEGWMALTGLVCIGLLFAAPWFLLLPVVGLFWAWLMRWSVLAWLKTHDLAPARDAAMVDILPKASADRPDD